MTARIVTPKGRRITVAQYLNLQEGLNRRTNGEAPPCEAGHYACALWVGGPCAAELAGDREDVDTVVEPQALTDAQQARALRIACALSPENLTCDGEASPRYVASRRRALKAEWKALEVEVGRRITEDEVWVRHAREYNRA